MGKWGEVLDKVHPDDPLLPGCLVETSDAACTAARPIGETMEENKRRANAGGDPLISKAGDTNERGRYLAILAQFGAAVATGLDPERTGKRVRDRADLGRVTEVRSSAATIRGTRPRDAMLRLYESEVERHPERAYVLVLAVKSPKGEGRWWWIRGWLLAGDAVRYPLRKYDPSDREACYWIPSAELKVEPVPEVQEILRRRRR